MRLLKDLSLATVSFGFSAGLITFGVSVQDTAAIVMGAVAAFCSSVLWWWSAMRMKKLIESRWGEARAALEQVLLPPSPSATVTFDHAPEVVERASTEFSSSADDIPSLIEERLRRARGETETPTTPEAPATRPFASYEEKIQGPDSFSDLETLDALRARLSPVKGTRLILTDLAGGQHSEVSLSSVVQHKRRLGDLLCSGIFPGVDLVPDVRIDVKKERRQLVNFLSSLSEDYVEVIIFLPKSRLRDWSLIIQELNRSQPEVLDQKAAGRV